MQFLLRLTPTPAARRRIPSRVTCGQCSCRRRRAAPHSALRAAGGFNPGRVLPCVIDVGTNNEQLRMEPWWVLLLLLPPLPLPDAAAAAAAPAAESTATACCLPACRYMGLKQPRLRGDAYYEVVDEFVAAVMGRWPKAVLQVGSGPRSPPSLLILRVKYHPPTSMAA